MQLPRQRPALLLLALLAACRGGEHVGEEAPEPAEQPAPEELRLDYSQDFEDVAALGDFAFSDPDAWRWTDDGGRGALELYENSDYSPPHRSPHSIALLADRVYGNFTLEAELLQTGREYGHRDLCLFFGYQSPERYYYVHLASQADENAHNVFLVDGAPRRRVGPEPSGGVDWGAAVWHRVRLERRIAEGTIRVFFDDMEQPVLEAVDRSFTWGRVGFGSFDDTGRFARVRISAPSGGLRPELGNPFP